MEPQVPPLASPASPSHHHISPYRNLETIPSDENHTKSENDAHQRHYNSQLEHATGRSHDSVISHPFSPKASSPPSPSSSISSARRQSVKSPEIRQISSTNVTYPSKAHIDPEKAVGSPQSPPPGGRVSSSNPDVTAVLYDSGNYNEKGPEENAVRLLPFLSGPCAFLSFITTLWAFLALFIAILIQPFQLFSKSRTTLSGQLKAFLAPPLNLQLHLIYSSSAATDYSPPMLIVVHLFSPLVAMGVAAASWTAAFFWFFSAILGDPAGQDGHNDGRDSILGVRNWWDRWLSRALR